jgi:hypothetical protein
LRKTNVILAALIVCGLLIPATAGAQILDLTKRFQVITRKDTTKLHGDLNKAGQNNIRVATGTPTGGDELLIMLEQDKDKGVYQYLVVSASDPTEIEKQLSRGSSQGFKLLTNTIAPKSKTFGSGDIVMLMEKGPRFQGSYEYLLLDASMGSTMQVTLAASIDDGYSVVGMIKKKKALLLILEKQS